jgi:hypothetical protein
MIKFVSENKFVILQRSRIQPVARGQHVANDTL